jgi:glycosyl transferase, family 25
VHAKHGYELHEARISRIFGELGLPFELITAGDPSVFTPELINQYFRPDIRSLMPDGIVSCTLNHMFSYMKIVERRNKYALVFENDPFFLGDFAKQIEAVAKEADTLPPGFIISLENTSLEFPPLKELREGKLLYQAIRGRCAGAYMIDLRAAERILDDLKTNKCEQVIDWWHNSMIGKGIVRMYWAHPPLVEQGSHNGLMSSTISTKRKNVIRRLSWLAQKYYKMYVVPQLKALIGD